MLTSVLLYVWTVVALSTTIDQVLVCWFGWGPWTKQTNDLSWRRGTAQVSTWRWVTLVIASTLWLIYGAGGDEKGPDTQVMTVNGIYWAGYLMMALTILALPPRRSRLERFSILAAAIGSLMTITATVIWRQKFSQFAPILVWLPLLATLGFSLLGRFHQVAMLIVSRRRGRLTLAEAGMCVLECAIWAGYGFQHQKWEIWVPCVALGTLDVIRLVLVLRYREPSEASAVN